MPATLNGLNELTSDSEDSTSTSEEEEKDHPKANMATGSYHTLHPRELRSRNGEYMSFREMEVGAFRPILEARGVKLGPKMTVIGGISRGAWRAFLMLTNIICQAPDPETKFENIFNAMALDLSFILRRKFPAIKETKGDEVEMRIYPLNKRESDKVGVDAADKNNLNRTFKGTTIECSDTVSAAGSRKPDVRRDSESGVKDYLHLNKGKEMITNETPASNKLSFRRWLNKEPMKQSREGGSTGADKINNDIRNIENLERTLGSLKLEEEMFMSESEEEDEKARVEEETSWTQGRTHKNPEQLKLQKEFQEGGIWDLGHEKMTAATGATRGSKKQRRNISWTIWLLIVTIAIGGMAYRTWIQDEQDLKDKGMEPGMKRENWSTSNGIE